MRELEGIPLLLGHCNVDDHNPCILVLIQLSAMCYADRVCNINLHLRCDSLIKSFFSLQTPNPKSILCSMHYCHCVFLALVSFYFWRLNTWPLHKQHTVETLVNCCRNSSRSSPLTLSLILLLECCLLFFNLKVSSCIRKMTWNAREHSFAIMGKL